ncbi:CAB/ELIP/HLIP family protein [Cyanobacterium stanieri PCC 7202]|uniref:CAB/ELIP/HLIP family protein n=1 Tax=Cyanobacterium stanieri (strain ATCC 29140 / PCC 7202) TaxID=292563 RepID=K9YLI1_CYASC|nr:CAB/ELIP/HLIP family protein [Cyanobacterium stanieri PCC 7202]
MNTRTNTYVTEDQGRLNNYAVEPKMYVDSSQQFGFNKYAEKLNGRLAMIGFISLIGFEVLTGQGLISWLTNL